MDGYYLEDMSLTQTSSYPLVSSLIEWFTITFNKLNQKLASNWNFNYKDYLSLFNFDIYLLLS